MRTKRYFAALAAAASLLATACTKDSKEEELVFPESQTVTIDIDEEKALSFKANADWKLSIDKPWLVFVDGGNKVSQISGLAGDAAFTVTTTDVTSEFEEETATINITMKDKTQALFTVTRNPKEREAYLWAYESILDTEMKRFEELGYVFDGGNVSAFKIFFSANFDWTVKSAPEWMDIELFSGSAVENPAEAVDASKAVFVGVKEESYPFAQEGEIVLTDMNGANEFKFPVKYAGMGEGDFIVKATNRGSLHNGKGLSFSAEGFLMSNASEPEPTEDKSIEVTVKTAGQEHSFLFVEEIDNTGWGMYEWYEAEWVKATVSDDKGTVTVSVDENIGKARRAYLVVVPKSMKGDAKDVNVEWFSENYDNFYEKDMMDCVIPIDQKGVPSKAAGFVVAWGGYEPVELMAFGDYPEFSGMAPSEMGMPDNTMVAVLSYDGGYPLTMAPLGFPEEWMPWAEGDMERPLFRFLADGWPLEENSIEFAQVYAGNGDWTPHSGISYPNEFFKQAEGMAQVLFYETEDSYNMWTPSAALILIKQ